MLDNSKLIIEKVNCALDESRKAQSFLSESLEMLNSGLFILAIKRIENASEKYNSCLVRLEHIRSNSGMASSVMPGIGKKIKCEVSGEIFHIRLDSLLPNNKDSRDKSNYEKSVRERQGYINAVSSFYESSDIIKYNEAVVVYFKHHFISETSMIDVDNFDVKGIMDVITSYMLIDDNPKWVSMYCEGVEDKEEYSEIFVIPRRKFNEFIS